MTPSIRVGLVEASPLGSTPLWIKTNHRIGFPVETFCSQFRCRVGTGILTKTTADTGFIIVENDSLGADKHRARRTNLYTLRIFTVVAQHRNNCLSSIWESSFGFLKEIGPVETLTFSSCSGVVFRFACERTRPAGRA